MRDPGETAKLNVAITSAPAVPSFHCQLVGAGDRRGMRPILLSNEARHWDIFISEFQVGTYCHFRCYSKSYHLLECIWYHIYLQHSNFSLKLRECGKTLRLLVLDMFSSARKIEPSYILQGKKNAQFLIISDAKDSIRRNN